MKQKAVVRYMHAGENPTTKQLDKSVGVGISGCGKYNESIRDVLSISLIVQHKYSIETTQENASSDSLRRLCA